MNVALRSGSSNNQTVSVGSSIDEIVYDITTDCTQIIQLVGSTGLPNGISATIEADELKISGTVSGQSSGTFNYVVEIDNHLEQTSSAPFVSATVSRVLTGTISVISESAIPVIPLIQQLHSLQQLQVEQQIQEHHSQHLQAEPQIQEHHLQLLLVLDLM